MPDSPTWIEALQGALPLYGHRNWIVVADAAYPLQAREGIDTLVADADQIDVLARVLHEIDGAPHVRPTVYVDAELDHLDDADAPGSAAYRDLLSKLVEDKDVRNLNHEAIIQRLDEAAQTFRVLVIKTNMTLPYTSVFIQLDCGYWSPGAEDRLRTRMLGL